MQRTIVSLILLLVLTGGLFYSTNHMGLRVVVTRDYASSKATQTLGHMEVLNWWGHTVFKARTLEVSAKGNRLHTGRFKLFPATGNILLGGGRQATYGIYEDGGIFNNVTKDKLFLIRPASNVKQLDGSIAIGSSIKVLSKGAIWLNDSIETHQAFMKLMDSKQDSRLLVRAYGDSTPKYTLPLPEFHPFKWMWSLIKFII